MNRREAMGRMLQVGGGVAAGLTMGWRGLFGQEKEGSAASERPNIVFILIDDLRWDAMRCTGNPFVKTPNIDRIADEGARFADAFVTIALCAPSRASFLTGMYAHSHGVRTNRGEEFDHKLPTFPRALQEAGYDTAFIGKWHMARTSEPRPGFNYWLSFMGQGVYENPTLNENGREFKADGYMTDLLTDYAVKWLRQSRNKPFCLYLSHKAVHAPFTPAERHKDLYNDVAIPKPASFDDTFESKPAWQRAAAMGAGKKKGKVAPDRIPPSIPPPEWDPKAKNRLDYYRALAGVDDSVGRVLQTLQELGKLDSTVVIFAGDNGYFQGEHRRGDKRLAYEESIRIPFLLSYPRRVKAGTVVNKMVLHIDLAPTLLDLAGARIPPSMQGRSFRPLLEGKGAPWRSSFLYEYFEEKQFGAPTILGVRTEEWKYVTYPEIKDLDELYDLKNDPHEMRNLAQSPACAAKAAELRAELDRLIKETGYTPAKPVQWSGPTELVLQYTFDNDTDAKAVDGSGKGNDGEAHDAALVEGRTGKARRFDGRKSVIRAPKSATLDPSGKPILVEAWVKAEKERGVVCAHGGKSQGYALYLDGGAPMFTWRVGDALVTVSGKGKIGGEWTHLAGKVAAQGRLELYVNGDLVGTADQVMFIPQNPNDGMTIGADEGSRVIEADSPMYFAGLIDEVRVYHGEVSAEEIARRSRR